MVNIGKIGFASPLLEHRQEGGREKKVIESFPLEANAKKEIKEKKPIAKLSMMTNTSNLEKL